MQRAIMTQVTTTLITVGLAALAFTGYLGLIFIASQLGPL